MTAEATQTRERRIVRRRPLKKGVTIEARTGALGLGPNIAVEARTLSDDGLCLHVTRELDKNTELEIRLTGIGRSKPMRLMADVRWCRPADEEGETFSVGIRFRKRIAYNELANYV